MKFLLSSSCASSLLGGGLAFVLLASSIGGGKVHAQAPSSSFYPSDHFDYVTKMTNTNDFNEYTLEQISNQGKTVFTRFIASEG